MPYLFLGVVALLLIWLLSALLRRATRAQLYRAFGVGLLVLSLLTIIVAVMTGRYGFIFVALPIGLEVFRRLSAQTAEVRGAGNKMSRREALDILGLAEGATRADVERAYRDLMQKNHPDHGGTDYFARQLNAARARLNEDANGAGRQ